MSLPPQTKSDIPVMEIAKRGELLIEVLGLKKKRNGRVNTTWGDKTAYGLALTVERIIKDGQ